MADRITPERRSANMSRIRNKNTGPELAVRRALRSLGIGYRLHSKDLPGHPDIVLRSRRKVIFVHGCFWHRHPGCRFAYSPKSRESFWQQKFAGNVARDAKNFNALLELGWAPLIIWECETKNPAGLIEILKSELGLVNAHPIPA